VKLKKVEHTGKLLVRPVLFILKERLMSLPSTGDSVSLDLTTTRLWATIEFWQPLVGMLRDCTKLELLSKAM
jgi:hypothetical protein